MGRGPGFEFTATGLKEKSQLVLAAPGSRCVWEGALLATGVGGGGTSRFLPAAGRAPGPQVPRQASTVAAYKVLPQLVASQGGCGQPCKDEEAQANCP